jgi:Uma2 family endonuclease
MEPSDPPPSPRRAIPVGPSVDAWRAMSPAARERFLLDVLDALSDPRDLMTEGRPHKRAKTRALDLLGLHFKAMGRVVYLAEEMAVAYPGEESFSPDVLAVVDVPQPEDDERMAWVVADEGRGLDLALEVLHRGDREKDLVRNVERYARLGIPEYFVYDRAQQRIHGFRLVAPNARRYQRIVPQAGRYSSAVLGLDLAVQGGTLRFFQGMAELFGTRELIERLAGVIDGFEVKADAEAAKADAEAARALEAVAGLRAGVLAAFEARGVPCSGELRARVAGSDDPATLQRWLLRALTAATATDALAE